MSKRKGLSEEIKKEIEKLNSTNTENFVLKHGLIIDVAMAQEALIINPCA